MERNDAIRKIEKLMAIAGDSSASDQEIQLATYRANKLMLQYKIDNLDLIKEGQTQKNVEAVKLSQKSDGYFIWILNIICKSYQCKCSYQGKINTGSCSFELWGFKQDIEMLRPVAEGLLYYLNSNIRDLKECYIGDTDFRVFKRNYYDGFSSGIKTSIDNSLREIADFDKYELMLTSVPVPVQELFESKVKMVKSHTFKEDTLDGYHLGKQHGKEYDHQRADLLEGAD